MKEIALLVFLLLSANTQAQWFQASASAQVINDDIDQAREMALKKAVKDALLYSGGEISNLQQVEQGVLVENKLLLNSSGEIKALQVINENQENGLLTVEIKVNIIAKTEQCIGKKYPKSIAVSRFTMNVAEQTVQGQIYDIHKKISETLFKQLSLNPALFDIRNYVDKPLKLGEKYNNINLVDTLRSLSAQTDSQFVIFGEINDLSVQFESKNSFSYWLTTPPRHFYMTVYLYDALQGELIFSKQYRQKAAWEYGKEETADLNSKRFWEYQYGQGILNLLEQVDTDIYQAIQCEVPKARVFTVASNEIQINLGKKNGLQPGTMINLSYSNNFKDQFGIERQSATVAEQTMKVIQSYENSAVLTTIDNYPLSNIQINDIATIKPLQ
ncbi:flagellar assembly protein FlgT [Psychromonas sp.]|nr:flagellar assembly protein FlgT [Psychromonas sp.]